MNLELLLKFIKHLKILQMFCDAQFKNVIILLYKILLKAYSLGLYFYLPKLNDWLAALLAKMSEKD